MTQALCHVCGAASTAALARAVLNARVVTVLSPWQPPPEDAAVFAKKSQAERPTLLNVLVGFNLYLHAQELASIETLASLGALLAAWFCVAEIFALFAMLNLRRWGTVLYAALTIAVYLRGGSTFFMVLATITSLAYWRRTRW